MKAIRYIASLLLLAAALIAPQAQAQVLRDADYNAIGRINGNGNVRTSDYHSLGSFENDGRVLNAAGSAFVRTANATVKSGQAYFTTTLKQADAPSQLPIGGLLGDVNGDGELTIVDVSLTSSMRRALLVLLTTAAVSAFPGTPHPRTQAMRRASLFLSSRGKKDIQLTLAHQGRPASRQQDTDEACYYVFNQPGEKGFVIIASDDGGEVLGYTDHGHFDTSLIPDNMQVLLDAIQRCEKHLVAGGASAAHQQLEPEIPLQPAKPHHQRQADPHRLRGNSTGTGDVLPQMALEKHYRDTCLR